MSWSLTKKLDFHLRVQARSRGGRWSWTLKLAEKRSRTGRWSWALNVRLLLLQLLLNSSAPDIVLVTLLRTAVETAIAWYTGRCAIARGHRRNIFVVLVAVHGLLDLPGWNARSSLYSQTCPYPYLYNVKQTELFLLLQCIL